MENTPQNTDVAILQKKQAAWSNFATESHLALTSLQTKAAKTVALLSTPLTVIEQIAESEATLAEAKKEANAIKADRLVITKKLEPFLERMMAPEKQLIAAIQAYESAIIALKKKKQEAQALVQAKEEYIRGIKEAMIKHVNDTNASYEKAINNQVTKAYEFALINAINAETIQVKFDEGKKKAETTTFHLYMEACKVKFKEEYFLIGLPPMELKYDMTLERLDAMFFEIEKKQPSEYILEYKRALSARFEYFSIAFQNKKQALTAAKKEQEEKAAQIAKEAATNNAVAALISMAIPLEDGPKEKALKQTYAVDMEDTQEAAMRIVIAFVANQAMTVPEIGVKSWMNLSVKQMAAALASVKNKDNAFSVSGINFKVVDKL